MNSAHTRKIRLDESQRILPHRAGEFDYAVQPAEYWVVIALTGAPTVMQPGFLVLRKRHDAPHLGVGQIHFRQPLEGIEIMKRNRAQQKTRGISALCNGPGKLCKAFGIDRSANGIDLCDGESRLFIESQNLTGHKDLSGLIKATPRIGVSGDEATKAALWRFVLCDP